MEVNDVLIVAMNDQSNMSPAAFMQGWAYFRRFKRRDGLAMRSLVAAVIFCETGQIVFLWVAVYKYTVTKQGDPTALNLIVPELIIELIFSGLVAFLVQHFYCYRIYKLSKNIFLAGIVSLCSIGCLTTLYYFIGVVLSEYTLLSELALQNNISVVTNVLGLLADISISVILITLLQRSKTGFTHSTDLINRLIIFSVNTGIPTSLTSILTVILLEAAPGTFIYIFLYLMLCHYAFLIVYCDLLSGLYFEPVSSEQCAMSIPVELSGRGNPNPNASTQESIAIRIEQTRQNFPDQKDSHSYADSQEHNVEGK
ncbi:hypothetical protein VKT23_014690 [Stygiomarasmius scandens]|uniref:DUF6534 domain-containing protein n=1 Tax=Marasmiellus scandens TaxID=2682957 RepID=A0ABR1J462_9AGAR